MSIFTADKIKDYIKKEDEQKIIDQNLYDKDISIFMKKIADNKFTHNELINILNKNPSLSVQTFQGLHSIHYGVLSNEPETLNTIIRVAINNGLTVFPNTEITSNSNYENNQPILKFTYKQNKLESFKTLFRFGAFEDRSIQEIVLLSMVDLNSDFNSFFKNIYGVEALKDLNNSLFSQKKYARLLANNLVSSNGNIKTLKKFGFDFFKESENGTLLHSIFSDSAIYYLDDTLKKTVISIDNKNKHYQISSYFLETILYHKDLNINSKDENGTPLYKILESYINNSQTGYSFKQNLGIKLQDLILNNMIPENKPTQKKNIKF